MLFHKINIIDGLKDGPEYVFYTDSSIAEVLQWKSDEKNGEWLKYTISGKPSLKAYTIKINFMVNMLSILMMVIKELLVHTKKA